jgi:hypothetical protein
MERTIKLPLVYRMREIMTVGVGFEVRYKFIKIARICLERATRGEVNISDDLVHSNATGNIAAFVRLLMELFCPVLISALNGIP